nr:peptidylprolyl isomerase [Pantoea sp. SoEX]
MRHNMKNWKILIIIMLIINTNLFAKTRLADSVAVVVNNDIILESEINNTNFIKYIKNLRISNINILRNKMVQDQIFEKIIFQLGKQRGLNITDDKLDIIIKDMSIKNHINLNEFRKILSDKNIKYDTYRNQIRKQIIIAIISNKEVLKRVLVYPEEINRLSKQIVLHKFNENQINLSQIILTLPENPTEQQLHEKMTLAKNLLSKIKKETDIRRLSKQYPDLFKIENMGWNQIKMLPEIFSKVLLNSKKGDVVGPIQSGVGLHILKVNDINNDNNINFSEMQIRFFSIKLNPTSMNHKTTLTKLDNIIFDFNSKKIDLKLAIKQLSNILSINQDTDSKWILFNDYSKQNIYKILKKLENNQMSKPFYFHGNWYIVQKLNIRKINAFNVIQKKISLMNVINNKMREEFESIIQQQIAKSYIKIIKK